MKENQTDNSQQGQKSEDKVTLPPAYFCASPGGSKNPNKEKIKAYCTAIGCPHLVDLNKGM